MEKKIYRIKIGNTNYWIGIGLQLVSQDLAIPVTFEEHIYVMEKLNVEATAYSEEYNPNLHKLSQIIIEKHNGAFNDFR